MIDVHFYAIHLLFYVISPNFYVIDAIFYMIKFSRSSVPHEKADIAHAISALFLSFPQLLQHFVDFRMIFRSIIHVLPQNISITIK